MKNLEQIRAAHALEPAKTLDKAAVNKLPALILTNGLLATISFCASEGGGDNRSHMARALQSTAEHLARCGLVANQTTSDLKVLAKDLSGCSSLHLQRVTSEALAYIGYLRRFAKKDKSAGDD